MFKQSRHLQKMCFLAQFTKNRWSRRNAKCVRMQCKKPGKWANLSWTWTLSQMFWIARKAILNVPSYPPWCTGSRSSTNAPRNPSNATIWVSATSVYIYTVYIRFTPYLPYAASKCKPIFRIICGNVRRLSEFRACSWPFSIVGI